MSILESAYSVGSVGQTGYLDIPTGHDKSIYEVFDEFRRSGDRPEFEIYLRGTCGFQVAMLSKRARSLSTVLISTHRHIIAYLDRF